MPGDTIADDGHGWDYTQTVEVATANINRYCGVVEESSRRLMVKRRAAAAARLARYRLRTGARADGQVIFSDVVVTVEQPGHLFTRGRCAVVATARTVSADVGFIPPADFRGGVVCYVRAQAE